MQHSQYKGIKAHLKDFLWNCGMKPFLITFVMCSRNRSWKSWKTWMVQTPTVSPSCQGWPEPISLRSHLCSPRQRDKSLTSLSQPKRWDAWYLTSSLEMPSPKDNNKQGEKVPRHPTCQESLTWYLRFANTDGIQLLEKGTEPPKHFAPHLIPIDCSVDYRGSVIHCCLHNTKALKTALISGINAPFPSWEMIIRVLWKLFCCQNASRAFYLNASNIYLFFF